LEEEGHDVEEARDRGEEDDAEDESRGEAPVVEERGLDQGVRRGALAVAEGGEEGQADGGERGAGGGPAVGRALDEGGERAGCAGRSPALGRGTA
jgi:hypothetical protein